MASNEHYDKLRVINEAIDIGRQRIAGGATHEDAYIGYIATLKREGITTPEQPREDHMTLLPQPINRQGEL